MSSSKEEQYDKYSDEERDRSDVIQELKQEGYIVWPPNFVNTRQQCFMCGQWQSVKVMKPVSLTGLTEIICASCYNKLVARDDVLQMEIERSEYGTGEQPGEGSAFRRPEEGGDNSGEDGLSEGT